MHHLSTLIAGARQRVQTAWTQGSEMRSTLVHDEATNTYRSAYSYCLIGSLAGAATGDTFRTFRGVMAHNETVQVATRLVARAIRRRFPFTWLVILLLGVGDPLHARIAAWNDNFANQRKAIKVLEIAERMALKMEAKEVAAALAESKAPPKQASPEVIVENLKGLNFDLKEKVSK